MSDVLGEMKQKAAGDSSPGEGRGREVDIQRVYGEIAGAYEAFFPALHRYEGRVEHFLADTVPPGRRVLDVGCGPGHLTRGLAAPVQVVGVDLSPEMIALAREGRPSGDYHVHSYHAPLPAGLGRFDVALAVGCLDFCEDLGRVLGHVSAALEPGGRLLFTVLERRAGLAGHEAPRRRILTAGPEVEALLLVLRGDGARPGGRGPAAPRLRPRPGLGPLQ